MPDLAEFIIILAVAVFGPGALIAILVFLNVEKVQKWGAIIAYWLSKFGGLFWSLHKKAVQLDLEGNINEYVKKVARDIPTLETQKVKIELVDKNTNKQSILSNDTVILRLRRDDPHDLNFVHGAYLFVSTGLLFRVKRYLSPSQRDALDLFVTTRMIEREKPAVVDHFIEEYLDPQLKDTKSDRAEYYGLLSVIDKGGLFFPVLLEELHFLGRRVFGHRQDQQIITEVHGLMKFLEGVSQRKVGTDMDLHFKKDYCKSAIMIIGKKFKLADSHPYTKYLREVLCRSKIETIYVIGLLENKQFVTKVCRDVSNIYSVLRTRTAKTLLNYEDGTTKAVESYIVVLELIGAPLYQPA